MADVKPATDADVDRCRNLYSYLARTLAARIDKEIEDRLAAEARVKVLEETLQDLASEVECWRAQLDRTMKPRRRVDPDAESAAAEADIQLDRTLDQARAALKEPANG